MAASSRYFFTVRRVALGSNSKKQNIFANLAKIRDYTCRIITGAHSPRTRAAIIMHSERFFTNFRAFYCVPFACFTVAAGHIIIMPADWDISAWSVHDPVVDSVPTRYIEPMLDQCRPAVYDVGPTLTNIGSMSRVCWGTVRRNVTDVGATRHDPCTVTYSKRPHFSTIFFF